MTSNQTVRIAAIGDLLLTSKPPDFPPGRGLEALSDEVRELFAGCDIILANLECTFPGPDMVATEPRVFTTEKQLDTLAAAGINVVTLANNHAFDAMDHGFQGLTAGLAARGIAWCGAGRDLVEATRPAIITVHDMRVAILGVVDASSGMYHFASPTASGVAPVNRNSLCRQITALRQTVDHVVLSPHWGEERSRFPSPAQLEQAHAFVDAGASLVLGHHPHVVQGLELHRQAPISYSLGNFLANHVYWDNGDFLTWNRFERTGCIVIAEMDKVGVRTVKQLPVYDDGTIVDIDRSGHGERYLSRANRYLAHGITPSAYHRELFRVRTLRPIADNLHWTKLKRIRPAHLLKLHRLLARGLSR